MDYFGTYVSNTLAGSGNQFFFRCEDPAEPQTGRVYYRIFQGGRQKYSLLYSNTIDSTFGDGAVSRCNLVCGSWQILSLKAGLCQSSGLELAVEPEAWTQVLFHGQTGRTVEPGELFCSDPFALDAEAGGSLCLEITFRGAMLPCHEESMIAMFRREGGMWKPSVRMPVPSMVGCDRQVSCRIGFLGDSVTQGIGSAPNSYAHWNAVAADALGGRYAYWNLGLGYGRASDAASDGAWLYKAKQVDLAVVCMGINDLLTGRTAEELKGDLETICRALRQAGARVVVQTVPPFEYERAALEHWHAVNDHIRTDLARQADGIFDAAALLAVSGEQPHTPRFGGHPNEAGCRLWGEALAAYLRQLL